MPNAVPAPSTAWGDLPVLRKDDGADPGSTALESLGLAWLAEAMADGGAAVVPTRTGPGWLEEPRLVHLGATPAAAEALGRALAVTHAAGAPVFGSAPRGWTRTGWMGSAWLPLVPHPVPGAGRADGGAGAGGSSSLSTPGQPAGPQPGPRRWGEFYAADRLLPYLPGARDNGSIDMLGARALERLASRLTDGDLDAPQPALVEQRARERAAAGTTSAAGPAVARTHGDLWSGNIVWTSVPTVEVWQPEGTRVPGAQGVVGVLIDPAAQGGHAETDLAELAVFGQPHLNRVIAGYQEVSPLADGWRERVGLHQLHMLLIHAVLFGGSYGPQTIAVARRYA